MRAEHHWLPYEASRVLRIDGDGLAYYCAGRDDTPPEQARYAVDTRINHARRLCGAGSVEVLLTDGCSHKGHRYAVATVKPYQGQRRDSRRPANWSYLRGYLESRKDAQITTTAEADDLFGVRSKQGDVIFTQDKDMRMVDGVFHMNWESFIMVYVPVGTWEQVWDDEVFGRKWFWLQMLMGDDADFIPGLPRIKKLNAKGKETLSLCGKVTASKLLQGVDHFDARLAVYAAYAGFYGREEGAHRLAEQAVLLWMRRKGLGWRDVFEPGHPLDNFPTMFPEVIADMHNAIQTVESYNGARQGE